MSQITKSVPCSQCLQPIDVSDMAVFLETVGAHVRLRCPHPRCGATDWYAKKDMGLEAEGDGKVWSFDFLLEQTKNGQERSR